MDELEDLARSAFGIRPVTRLPITESFSSTVVSFIGSDDRHYVVKRHWARSKAEREIEALRALHDHPSTPALLATDDRDGTLTLLIEGLPGAPWTPDRDATPELDRALGRAMAQMHHAAAESFEGTTSWHELLRTNAERYVASIGPEDRSLAERGSHLLLRRLDDVPDSDEPRLVHFDLRPGNVLVNDGCLTGIIDFEACRGGHPSMDFFKLWQQVPRHLDGILEGYCDVAGSRADWAELDTLLPLVQIYAAYHGLAGLAWCHLRGDFSGDFPAVNRGLVTTALATLD